MQQGGQWLPLTQYVRVERKMKHPLPEEAAMLGRGGSAGKKLLPESLPLVLCRTEAERALHRRGCAG